MTSIARLALIASLSAAPAAAQDPATGWTPALEIRGVMSAPNGTLAPVSADRKLVKDEPFTAVIRSSANLCSLGMGESGAGPSAVDNVWKITGEYLGELGREGRFKIRVTHGFTRLAGRDAAGTTTQTLILNEGDEVMLDAVSAPPDGPCQAHTVALNARLVMRPSDAALERARYTADLWLVHTDPSGREQRQHAIVNMDGASVFPLVFGRLPFAIPQIDVRQGGAEAVIDFRGTLRLRPRADGLVDVDLDTQRTLFRLENPDRPVRRSAGSITAARKTLTVRVDETTAIDFPPPSSGYSSLKIIVKKVLPKISGLKETPKMIFISSIFKQSLKHLNKG